MRVQTPDGREWDVYRRLRWPEWRQFVKDGDDWQDALVIIDTPADAGGVIASIVVTVIALVVVTVFIILVAPLVVFVIEAAFVVIAAMALGRPWLVIAATAGPPFEERRWLVRGPLASRRAVREVADELRRGVVAEPEKFELEPLGRSQQ